MIIINFRKLFSSNFKVSYCHKNLQITKSLLEKNGKSNNVIFISAFI